jgi:hypothetical protein
MSPENQVRSPVGASMPYSVFVVGSTYHFLVVSPVSQEPCPQRPSRPSRRGPPGARPPYRWSHHPPSMVIVVPVT